MGKFGKASGEVAEMCGTKDKALHVKRSGRE